MLKNKNGTPYRLRGPNPLAKNQEIWSEKDLVLHNLDFEKLVFDDEHPAYEEAKEYIKPDPIIQPKAEKIKEEPKKEKSKPESPQLKNIVIMHCQPAKIQIRKDDLYEEAYATIQYGEKFKFEAIVIERNDLSMQFWATVDLPKGSVVFPAKYRDGVKFGDYRWWKVENTSAKSGGFLTETIMSGYQPDFSD